LRDIDLAVLVNSLWLLDDLEEGARNASGAPELWTAIICRISIGGTSLNPVTFLTTTVADVARRWRLVWDCCLLGKEWTVVDTFTIMPLVCGQRVVGR
jgi:hypothetical protein